MKYKNILIDFDGTLVDSSEGIFKSLIDAFNFYGDTVPNDETLRKFIGPPLFYSFNTICGFSPAHCEELTEKYHEYYENGGYKLNCLYDGIYDTLKELKNRGYHLATASSKPLQFVDTICSENGIKDFFDFLGGTEMQNTGESKSDVILKAMKNLKGTKEDTLMVGDTLFDIKGANAVGIHSCGVLYGFGTREEFIQNKATYIIEKPINILEIV